MIWYFAKCFGSYSLEKQVALTWQKVGQMQERIAHSFLRESTFTDRIIPGLIARFARLNLTSVYSPLTAINSPCSRTAWAPCGKDVAVGVSSSSRLVCGSGRPSQDFAGPFFWLWPPVAALCHVLWRPWDLEDTQRRWQLDNLARKWHFTASSHPEYHILIICLVHQCQRKMCSKIQRGITVVMDEETRDMYR